MAERNDGYGQHSIGYLGSVAILFSNGPAMLILAPLFQSAGWLTPTVLMLLMTFVASFASDALVECMASVGQNGDLQRRYEYSTLVKIYFPKQPWCYWTTVVLFNCSLISLNAGSIISSAQSIDFLAADLGWDGALELFPDFGFTVATTGESSSSTPFGNNVLVISFGYLIIFVLGGGLSFLNLDENVYLQTCSFLTNIAILLIWVVMWCMLGLHPNRVPVVTVDQAPVVGAIVFNYAFVLMIPSWANELSKGASVHGPVWWSTIIATVVFIMLGAFGGMALDFRHDEDLLGAMSALPNISPGFSSLGKWTASLLPILTVVPGIPIFSVLTRYSLMNSGFCGKHWANVWAIGIPYTVAVFFYAGAGLADVINWTAILFNGSVNFVIPFILYLRMLQLRFYNRLDDIVPPPDVGDECCVDYEPVPQMEESGETERVLVVTHDDQELPSSSKLDLITLKIDPEKPDWLAPTIQDGGATPIVQTAWLTSFRAYPQQLESILEPWICGAAQLVTMVVLLILALSLSLAQSICSFVSCSLDS